MSSKGSSVPPCYNIPVSLVDSFRNERVVIRSKNASELVESLAEVGQDQLVYLQLLSVGDAATLSKLSEPVRLDLVMQAESEFSCLYRFAELGKFHPIRVTVPLSLGCTRTVKLAVSLDFPVKLHVTRLDDMLVDELTGILEYYLHHRTASQPIDFFHSVLTAFYLNQAVTVWDIQEDNPSLFRYVTESGRIEFPRLLSTSYGPKDGTCFLDDYKMQLFLEQGDCSACLYFSICLGYFKIPDKNFDCKGVKKLFQMIKDVSTELKDSLSDFDSQSMEGVVNPQ
jgi:hypothetical protein